MSNLLAYIAINSRVDDISDLSMPLLSRQFIASINAEQFPLSDWVGAVNYLCKTKIAFTDAQEAKNYLLKQIETD